METMRVEVASGGEVHRRDFRFGEKDAQKVMSSLKAFVDRSMYPTARYGGTTPEPVCAAVRVWPLSVEGRRILSYESALVARQASLYWPRVGRGEYVECSECAARGLAGGLWAEKHVEHTRCPDCGLLVPSAVLEVHRVKRHG